MSANPHGVKLYSNPRENPPKKGFEAGKWREISGWREKGEKNGEKN